MADSGSKTEKATPKRRKDERKKGNAFSSKDVVNVMSILVVFYSMKLMFPMIYGQFRLFLEKYLNDAADINELTGTVALTVIRESITLFAITAIPILLISVLVAVVATGAQTRFNFSWKALKPKFSRISPLQGIKRIISLKSLIEVIKGLVKIIIVGAIVYRFFMKRLTDFGLMSGVSLEQSAIYVLNATISLVWNVSLIFIVIAGLDFLYQWWDYERQLRMSKQEVKEEFKQLEGDPQVKGKIRDIQRKFAMSRMMQAVPTADVIIRNPTHYAVALKYDIQQDEAPMVVAKGQDDLALRIIRVGEENDVFITENRPLARAIYETADVGREIPMEYYGAVAEVIALLYQMKHKTI